VADSSLALDELVDLKMLPAWANEPAPAERYAHVDGEEQPVRGSERPRHQRGRKGNRPTFKGETRSEKYRRPRSMGKATRSLGRDRENRHPRAELRPEPKAGVQFIARVAVLENVIAQIKENTVAYSLFALARLFLAKPERYQVHLTTTSESPLFQLGENGAISADRDFLERNAFRLAQSDFYKTDVTQSDAIKGNFTSVARDRLSGTNLGPTNHHDYQKRLRGLYEQRFSRRMSFADYQRQIEIVNDPQLVEQWKEDARKITTYSTLHEETPVSFATAAETERHFREKYSPDLIRIAPELTIDGPTSRRINDRPLYRLIENEWARENRSPSRMMQELSARFRQAGLQVFRQRRGMLFVSPIRPRPLVQENAAVSPSVKSIIETLAGQPIANRKELADKVLTGLVGEELERAKLTLASDLHWLIGEGHVIEFNDGSLDLPRVKAKQAQKGIVAVVVPAAENSVETKAAVVVSTAESQEQAADASASAASVCALDQAEIGGS